MKKGERISEELIRSIKDSKLHIIVFSKNYASSSWCLDELVKIMECQKMDQHTAYPVFYHVEPTEVRKQIRAVGEAFFRHGEEESAGKWREALAEAANLAGWELKTTDDGHEAKFIQRIVKEISVELRFSSWSTDPELIGMEERVVDVLSSLEIDTGGVRMIGIKGIGGGGKTTLAKAVFDQIAYLYEGSSFVENVRESAKVSGLKSLQKQVISDLLLLNDSDVKNVSGFSDLKSMKKKMRSRKVLLILDDVDHIKQLEALAGDTNWFKSGSRVIITTRDEQVLLAHGVPKNLILNVNLLLHGEAIRLFSRRAFGREITDHGFEMLSDQVLSYANGLPLTIKVLGSFLRGKDEQEWTDQLERLKEIPLKDTLDILELSYNSLEEDYKEIFLDVTCILKGWDKKEAIIALESCGFHARIGLKVLEQRSLITVSDSGQLSMHDHIEEMGKNIVRRLHPKKPYKHSRLWIKGEIADILFRDKGTKATRCVSLHAIHPLFVMKGLQKMKELRFLRVNSKKKALPFDEDSDCDDSGINCEDSLSLPNSLRYLSWSGYFFTCLPKSFHANNLVYLYMKACNFNQLWEGGERKVLKKLKFIELESCMLRKLDIGLAPNLERLRLNNCKALAELPMPAESFKLKILSIGSCGLKTLDLAWAQNLESLYLFECEELELHMPINNLKLESVDIRCCRLKTLDLSGARNLHRLYFLECNELEELCMPINNLKLESVEIRCCKLKTLDLAGAQNLHRLFLLECHELEELRMPIINLKLESVEIRCCKLKTLDLAGTRNLQSLYLLECEELEELHMPINNSKLESIKIRSCKMKTWDLTGAQNLGTVHVEDCHDLRVLQMPLVSLKLKDLTVRCSKLKALNLQGALNLRSLSLYYCKDLEELHMPTNILKLEHLAIRFCSKL